MYLLSNLLLLYLISPFTLSSMSKCLHYYFQMFYIIITFYIVI